LELYTRMVYLQSLADCNYKNEDIDPYLCSLIAYKIGTRIRKNYPHRRWIKYAYELLLLADVGDLQEGLRDRINSHDVSKYDGPGKALVYSIRQEFDGVDKNELLGLSCKPEHFEVSGRKMTRLDLQESLICHFASRMERTLIKFRSVAAKMLINGLFAGNTYDKNARELIYETQEKWIKSIHDLISFPPLNKSKAVLDWMKKTGLKLKSRVCHCVHYEIHSEYGWVNMGHLCNCLNNDEGI